MMEGRAITALRRDLLYEANYVLLAPKQCQNSADTT